MELTNELIHKKKGFIEKPSDLRLDMKTFEMLSRPGDRYISDKYHLLWRIQEVYNTYSDPYTVKEKNVPDVITPAISAEVLYSHMVRAYEWEEYCKTLPLKSRIIWRIPRGCSYTEEVESRMKELRDIELRAYAKCARLLIACAGLSVAVYISNSILNG